MGITSSGGSENSGGNGQGRVAGKVVLVTGAASGLGLATARLLAEEGARIVATDINGPGAEACAADIASDFGVEAIAIEQDVTSEEAWIGAIEQIEREFGALHVLVNNAGIGILGSVEDTSLEDWRRLHAIDLDSVFLGCKHAMGLMRKSGGGSIINMSSIAGIIAAPNTAAYNSAKAAVLHLSKSVALHGANSDPQIRCNSVHPVFVDTPILDPMIAGGMAGGIPRDDMLAKLSRQIPMGRVGQPVEVAQAVLFLASDEASFITGSEIKVDGGISAM